MPEKFAQYFVSNNQENKMENIKASVILGDENGSMFGVKYFANAEEAKLFAKIVGDFMEDALDEFELELAIETEAGRVLWPEIKLL